MVDILLPMAIFQAGVQIFVSNSDGRNGTTSDCY